MPTSQQFGSVTLWIRQLGGDNPEPAAVLWSRFEPQLLSYIIRRIRMGLHLREGEDALANAVFLAMIRLARRGKLTQTDRVGFWKLMKTIANRQITDQQRKENRQKRGGGEVISESVLRVNHAATHPLLDSFPSKDPSPDMLAMTAEFLHGIASLFDGELRSIFDLRLEGLTVEKIAHCVNKSIPTVERKLRLIRETLQVRLGIFDDN